MVYETRKRKTQPTKNDSEMVDLRITEILGIIGLVVVCFFLGKCCMKAYRKFERKRVPKWTIEESDLKGYKKLSVNSPADGWSLWRPKSVLSSEKEKNNSRDLEKVTNFSFFKLSYYNMSILKNPLEKLLSSYLNWLFVKNSKKV